MSDVPWMDWHQSLAKPAWTPAPRTIGPRRLVSIATVLQLSITWMNRA